MWPRRGVTLRVLAIILAQLVMVFWGWFTLVSFPWIVPADHHSESVRAYEHASRAGLGLLGVSATGFACAAGWFGRGRGHRLMALLLVTGSSAVTPWLYPALDDVRLSALRVPAQIASMSVILLGAIGWRLHSCAVGRGDSCLDSEHAGRTGRCS